MTVYIFCCKSLPSGKIRGECIRSYIHRCSRFLQLRPMKALNRNLPAILLVDRSASELGLTAQYLSGRGLCYSEAWDIYTAVNDICDFTQESRPDVIVVNVDSVSESYQILTLLLSQGTLGRMEYPVFTVAEDLPCKNEGSVPIFPYPSSALVTSAGASKVH